MAKITAKIKELFLKNIKVFCCLFFLVIIVSLVCAFRSKGDSYYTRLVLWYSAAYQEDWKKADRIEKTLDINDVIVYKKSHHPQIIGQKIQALLDKKNKTAEDWMEIARLQIILNNKNEALKSVTEARKLDPIRDDIDKLYFSLQQDQ